MKWHLAGLLFACWAAFASADASSVVGLKVPPGFRVEQVADQSLANDIYCMTIDARGRILVSGRGYLRWLVGEPARAVEVTPPLESGAMGLLVEGDTLYAVGDGGLWRYALNTDGTAKAKPEKLFICKASAEHDAHALKRGPDGWLYLLCGNSAGITSKDINSPNSPIRTPVAGVVLRFSPDFQTREVVADGLRNPYGFDFDATGELFAYDSDHERDLGLPWYEGTRLYHIVPGLNYGWENPQRAETWRKPPHMPDVVAPLVNLGRGSPTGVVCYRGTRFPAPYHRAIFCADWTFGRIYAVHLKHSGASYAATSERFLEATGDNGFAPTALAEHPTTGELYVSIGGRGTRGSVYRIATDTAVTAKPVDREFSDFKHAARRSLELLLQNPGKTDLDRVLGQADRSSDPILRQLRAAILQRYRPDTKLALPWDRFPLEAIRTLQLAHGIPGLKERGTVWEGYAGSKQPPLPEGLVAKLLPYVGGNDAALRTEAIRLLAMLHSDDAAAAEAVLHAAETSSDAMAQLHALIAYGRLTAAPPDATKRVAELLMQLEPKLLAQGVQRDRHWPLRMSELFAGLCARDPTLAGAMLEHPLFGRPSDALWLREPNFPRKLGAERILAKATGAEYPWNAELVALLANLPEANRLPRLRELWERGGLEEALLPLFAAVPKKEDRAKFLSGLRSSQYRQVLRALDALDALPAPPPDEELPALIRTLRALPEGKAEAALRTRLGQRLERIGGQKFGEDAKQWSAWLQTSHPELAKALAGADGVDVAAWQKRFDAIDWARGDAGRGAKKFEQASCSACHSGGQALGPDLAGVTGRFSRSDLFAAIVQPSKDISPRYRTTQILTTDGKTYQGMVIYEAVDGVILQTGPAETVRIAGGQIEARRFTETSLMPVGLLDRFSDAEIADLFAHLAAAKK